jgi:hypothetical protein
VKKPAPSGLPELLTRDEVAAWLQIPSRDVARYGIPCFKLGRKTLRYDRAEVLAWLKDFRKGGIDFAKLAVRVPNKKRL